MLQYTKVYFICNFEDCLIHKTDYTVYVDAHNNYTVAEFYNTRL